MRISLGIGIGPTLAGGAGTPPANAIATNIDLSASSVRSDALASSLVAYISSDGYPQPAFTEQADPDNKFTVSGNQLLLSATPGAGPHSVTIRATNSSGTYDEVFSISVVAIDTTPDAFSFTDVTGQALSTLIESSMITVAGINDPATITVAGGQYQINGGAWTSAAGTVVNGDTVKVRHTTDAAYSTVTNTTLTIGGVSDIFSSTTIPDPAGPSAPVLDWTSASSDATPEFNIDFDATVGAGDVITLQLASDAGFTSILQAPTDTLDSGEITAGEIDLALTSLGNGTYYARAKVTQGVTDSPWSNTETVTIAASSLAPGTDLVVSGWTKQVVTGPTAVADPDGGTTASRYANPVAGSNINRVFALTISPTGGTFYIAYKSSTVPYIHVRVLSGGVNYGRCIDTSTDAITAGYYDGTNLANAPSSSQVTALPSGWKRFQITQGTITDILIYFATSATTTLATFAGTETIDLWDAKIN